MTFRDFHTENNQKLLNSAEILTLLFYPVLPNLLLPFSQINNLVNKLHGLMGFITTSFVIYETWISFKKVSDKIYMHFLVCLSSLIRSLSVKFLACQVGLADGSDFRGVETNFKKAPKVKSIAKWSIFLARRGNKSHSPPPPGYAPGWYGLIQNLLTICTSFE